MTKNQQTAGAGVRGLASLRNFVRQAPQPERCDLCSLALAEQHQHLLDPQRRQLICACDPCAILFSSNGETNYRRVPRDVVNLIDFTLPDQAWISLAIPIGLAFIYQSSVLNQPLAVYPSPAGPTESPLDQESWDDVLRDNPLLSKLTPDVEALLINRTNGARDYYWVPIDECYRLAGIVRQHWRGFSGGEQGWEQISRFFDRLKERSRSKTVHPHAGSLV